MPTGGRKVDLVQADVARRREEAADNQRDAQRLGVARGAAAVGRAAAHAASAAGVPLALAAGVALSAASEAYVTIVANRGKAKKLLDRMQLLQPAVDELAQMLDDGKLGDRKKRDGALAVLTRVRGNFERARELIVEWSQRGAGFFGTLKLALSAGKFAEEFDGLREELVQRLAELQLYLAVRGVARAAVTRGAWKREDAEADATDRAALPGAIAEEAEGSSALGAMLQEAGMDLGTFKSQMAKHDLSFDKARLAGPSASPAAVRFRAPYLRPTPCMQLRASLSSVEEAVKSYNENVNAVLVQLKQARRRCARAGGPRRRDARAGANATRAGQAARTAEGYLGVGRAGGGPRRRHRRGRLRARVQGALEQRHCCCEAAHHHRLPGRSRSA